MEMYRDLRRGKKTQKKLEADGPRKRRRASVFSVGGVCGCGDHRPEKIWLFRPNSESFYGIRYNS